MRRRVSRAGQAAAGAERAARVRSAMSQVIAGMVILLMKAVAKRFRRSPHTA